MVSMVPVTSMPAMHLMADMMLVLLAVTACGMVMMLMPIVPHGTVLA